jgi:hypothetical protein
MAILIIIIKGMKGITTETESRRTMMSMSMIQRGQVVKLHPTSGSAMMKNHLAVAKKTVAGVIPLKRQCQNRVLIMRRTQDMTTMVMAIVMAIVIVIKGLENEKLVMVAVTMSMTTKVCV